MRTTITLIGIVLMWITLGAAHLGYLTGTTVALTEAGLIGAVWITNLIGRMMEEGY